MTLEDAHTLVLTEEAKARTKKITEETKFYYRVGEAMEPLAEGLVQYLKAITTDYQYGSEEAMRAHACGLLEKAAELEGTPEALRKVAFLILQVAEGGYTANEIEELFNNTKGEKP